jgi:hypothetical protein
LVAALLGFGGSSAASMEVQHAGLAAAVAAAAAAGRGSSSPLLEVSPSGLLSLLDCLRHLAAPDCQGLPLLLQPAAGGGGGSLLAALLGVLHERHVAALQLWPARAGGGREGVAQLVRAVAEVLAVPLATAGACLLHRHTRLRVGAAA